MRARDVTIPKAFLLQRLRKLQKILPQPPCDRSVLAMKWSLSLPADRGPAPLCCAPASPGRPQGYDNHNPRAWLAQVTGFRARANAAQTNSFEAFPFFASRACCWRCRPPWTRGGLTHCPWPSCWPASAISRAMSPTWPPCLTRLDGRHGMRGRAACSDLSGRVSRGDLRSNRHP